jgi:hypothetical protein
LVALAGGVNLDIDGVADPEHVEYRSPGRVCATHACGISAAAAVEITRS